MEATQPSLALPDKPSIAVLPFTNMSGDPEQEYFADGMVEEIITALSRIRWLFVIARNSSFTYKSQAVDVKQVGRDLGVRYVLEGSVRKAGGRVRITAQLIDAQSGSHLWADRFDGSLEDVFELQDQVAASVAGVIEPTLQAAEIRRSSERPTSDLTAYDLYLRALPHVTARERNRLAYAFDLLGRAIERDPHYGPALAQTAYYHYQLDLHGWADDRERNRCQSIDLAQQALRCAPDDPEVLAHAAHVLGYFDEDLDAAIALVDRALVLNPSYANGWYWSGVVRNWVGRPDLALEHFATFLRLSPRERFPFYLTAIGIALFFDRRFDEAAAKLHESLARFPNLGLTYRFLAASYAHMGRIQEAQEIAEHMRALNLSVLENGARYRNPEYRELYLSGLRLAAGEAT
jgi:adenylate cyclase